MERLKPKDEQAFGLQRRLARPRLIQRDEKRGLKLWQTGTSASGPIGYLETPRGQTREWLLDAHVRKTDAAWQPVSPVIQDSQVAPDDVPETVLEQAHSDLADTWAAAQDMAATLPTEAQKSLSPMIDAAAKAVSRVDRVRQARKARRPRKS